MKQCIYPNSSSKNTISCQGIAKRGLSPWPRGTRLLGRSLSALGLSLFIGCSKGADSFSTLADSKTFKQSATLVPKPVDILWVVDNSGSMANSQANLAANFQSFIQRFQSLNYDFRMGVGTTDAFLAFDYMNPSNNPSYINFSKLRDGAGTNSSGVFVMNPSTPNLQNVFITNITQGISGYGDERAFSSIEAIFSNSFNSDFRRSSAFLAIIIVSDEDDFSHDSNTYTDNYNDTSIKPIAYYKSYLDTLTGSTADQRNYSVNAITIMDGACLAQLADLSQKIGQRYMDLVDATGGIKGSLCSNFGDTLNLISGSVLELSSNFILDRKPVPSSIEVTVNGRSVPEDGVNGWTFDQATNSISFHGTAIPPADAAVKVDFDPTTVLL